MLVHNQVESALQGLRPPSPGYRAVMLDFDNVLLEHEADLQKPLHHTERKRHKMPALAGIADKNRAVFVRLQLKK